MKASTVNKILSVLLLSIVIAFAVHIIGITNERASVSTQVTFKQLGLDLSAASDFLTNQARAYVQYGEKKYYDAYMTEVEVTKTREHVVAELKRLGAPDNELALVQKAAELSNTLAQLESLAFEAVGRGDLETARQLIFGTEYDTGKAPIVSTMQEFQNAMEARTQKAADAAKKLSRIILVVFAVLLATVIVAAIFALQNTQHKMKRVTKLAECASEIAVGNMDVVVDTTSHDEVGLLAESFRLMVSGIQKQVEFTEYLANGDLTVAVHPRSKKDAMGIALEKLAGNLGNMFRQINASTIQVSTEARQLADSSLSLAHGATEQAETVERLSITVSEVDRNAKDNADLANKASDLANKIKNNAEKGSEQMSHMVLAVKEINEASQKIQKVIKVIDDIAFQTNILALNAAVEAARAGQHGKGFAVVAEEVRSLAAKSAAAAKDTDSLIVDAMEKAEYGVHIAAETASSLTDIMSGITESSIIIGNIAEASESQSETITEINRGIDSVTQVIQSNSATAEENAAAAQEMSGQSELLHEMITQFKL